MGNKLRGRAMKLSKITWCMLLCTVTLLLWLCYLICRYHFISNCIDNWLNEDFTQYTGKCVSVTYDIGRPTTRYSNPFADSQHQFLTGQGWHFLMDNGSEYYIPAALCNDKMQYSRDSLLVLASEEITIQCLPSSHFSNCNVVVSLRYGDCNYLHSDDAYVYLQKSNTGSHNSVIFLFVPFFSSCSSYIFFVWMDIDTSRTKRKKQKLKEEKMQRLIAEGKLHPTKQLQKKKKSN